MKRLVRRNRPLFPGSSIHPPKRMNLDDDGAREFSAERGLWTNVSGSLVAMLSAAIYVEVNNILGVSSLEAMLMWLEDYERTTKGRYHP